MPEAVPDTCQLSHASFRMLKDPVFRLSEGALVPSMVIHLESQEAVLPLRSVAREFGIAADTPDGRMLNLIEQALDYVVAIRLGDKLPSELIGGEASWDPNEQDRRIALSRIRYNLVRCVSARTGKTVDIGASSPGWEDSPKNRELLNRAVADAAELIESTDAAEITSRIAALSEEMAYIESMRRMLARGTGHIRDKLLRVPIAQVPVSRQDTVKQVQSLARIGLKEIMSRFDDVDLRLDDTLAMLRNIAATTGWIRKQRDWLFRTNYAWGAVFTAWANAPSDFDDFLWKVIERTYLFLAPRFMSFREWKIAETRLRKDAIRVTVW